MPDSGGPVKQRGSLSSEIDVRSIDTRLMTMDLRFDKLFFNLPGLTIGQPVLGGQVVVIGEEITRFPALPFNPSDDFRLLLPGGGGFEQVAERAPGLILHDLQMGYISDEAAEHDCAHPWNRRKTNDR